MRVFTYFQPVRELGPQDRLLELWKRNWTEHGFEPVILSEKDAMDHPGYDYYVSRISRFPTSNPRDYERACFMRHLAMANVGGGLLVDTDVLTNPKARDVVIPEHPFFTIECLEPTRVPCAMRGNAQGFEDLCDTLCEYNANGDKHVSDMTIIRKTKINCSSMCVEHLNSGEHIENDPGDGWKKAPLIHFSTFSFSKLGWRGNKAEMIQKVLATL